MDDYPVIEIGREHNDVGEPLVRVGGAITGTVDTWKRAIAGFEGQQPAPAISPDDPEFKKAVVAVVLEMKRKRVL